MFVFSTNPFYIFVVLAAVNLLLCDAVYNEPLETFEVWVNFSFWIAMIDCAN